MIQDFAGRLLAWFDQHGRKHLPWQQDITPYRVWVSEIMLQQTQVTTVIPYYEAFMDAFPDVHALAAASQDQVLHRWTGLGYYARARNLHKSAQIISGERQGKFPLNVEDLEALPGIGRSTAGAIVAICTDSPATILDGNVKRVLARCFAIEGWAGKRQTSDNLWATAEQLTPTTRVADYTQAIMDLGATICTRSKPDCVACPFVDDCTAFATNRIAEFPGKKPKKTMPVKSTTMFVVENTAGELLLYQRDQEGLWGGLWSFPEAANLDELCERYHLPTAQPAEGSLEPFRHTFTHFHLDITPIRVKLANEPQSINEDGLRWYTPGAGEQIGLTKPVTHLLQKLLDHNPDKRER